MFDFTSSKLLLLGIVALLVIGPKDLPALLRTIGKYVGIIKRQAAEFRAQFDEAMRESELAELKKSVEGLQQETEQVMRDATSSVEKQLEEARESVEAAVEDRQSTTDAIAYGGNAPPADTSAAITPETPEALNGAAHPTDASVVAANEAAGTPSPAQPGEAGRATEKSGA
jgi:sec-independent protein translocase protein TatB